MLRNLITACFLTAILYAITPAHVGAADFDFSINPELDISRFSPYNIYVTNIPDDATVDSVDLIVTAINGNGGGETCWDYYVDGTCESEPVDYLLTRNIPQNRWESANIYPDTIYPEIFFAPSSITWSYTPLQTNIYRESYALLRMNNPFTMVADMSLWVELNAVPASFNSADLEVFIADNTVTAATFRSDWRESAHIEAIGTLPNTADFHHTHSANSSHHLVSLQTNADGTIGVKNLDVSDGYWVILYSKSPNVNRGWKLRYHPSTICNNAGYWYTGSRFGWTTTATNGCPDVHSHIARRTVAIDGVHAVATAHYSNGSTATDEDDFYFGTLPNLAPNGTTFTNPYRGGAYEGTIDISWDPASDANNDTLTYTIDLLNSDKTVNQTLATDTLLTTVSFDTTTVDDGIYYLKGTVCDDDISELCTDFLSDTFFYVNNGTDIVSLTDILVSSTNNNPLYAKSGDTVTLTFESSGELETPTVELFSGGYDLHNSVSVTEIGANTWTAVVVISSQETDGRLSFDIISSNLDRIYDDTTDNSTILVDVNAPEFPLQTLGGIEITPGEGITVNTARPVFQGVTEPQAYIRITVYSDTISGEITAEDSGDWSWIPGEDIPDGSHRVVITATDLAGNTYQTEFSLIVNLVDTGVGVVWAYGVGIVILASGLVYRKRVVARK